MLERVQHRAMIVGLGQIGMGYDLNASNDRIASHARAFSMHEDFFLACGVDTSPERREVFTKAYSRPAYASVKEALAAQDVAVAAIGVPTHAHQAVLLDILDHDGVKTVLCEKPLAPKFDTARAMVQACDEKGVALYVNYIRRSLPGVAEIMRMLDEGEIASPIRVVIWYSKGFVHNGLHFFDLMKYWLGSVKDTHLVDAGRMVLEEDVEPAVRVVFERGEVHFIPAWEEHFSHHSLELLSASGRLYWKQDEMTWQSVTDHAVFKGYRTLNYEKQVIDVGLERYQFHVVSCLADALAGLETPLCTGDEALDRFEDMVRILDMRNA